MAQTDAGRDPAGAGARLAADEPIGGGTTSRSKQPADETLKNAKTRAAEDPDPARADRLVIYR